jgi:large subunit ribosomal protein L4
MAKRRAGTHSTKTRGAVSGSTRKIYRQKGTGRARHGSIKAPIFVGGGITFGPSPRSYAYTLPKSARRRGLQTALAIKSREGKLLLLEAPSWKQAKTKQAVDLFKALKVESALLVLDERSEVVEKSVRNLKKYKALSVNGLNVYDILNFEHLILTEGALKKVVERLDSAATA